MIFDAAIILAAIAAVSSILLFIRNEERLTLDDSERQKAPGKFIRLSDGFTHYEMIESDAARTVVLVHGFSTWSFTWAATVQALVEAGFRVVRYDLYGRGYSDRPDAAYDKDLFDRQLSELLSNLGVGDRVDLVGSSMGGLIATTYAARRPERVRTLTLIDPAFYYLERVPFPLGIPLVGAYAGRVFVVPFLARVQTRDFKFPGRFPDYERTYRIQMRYKGYARAILSTIGSLPTWDALTDLGMVSTADVPVLLVWGREDKTIPLSVSERIRQIVPCAELHVIDDAAHMPHYELPEIVSPIIVRFLSQA